VRDATFDVLRRHDMTTIFANPGSTEIDFLGDLPDDLRFVLGLHEASVVGMATGYALGRDRPSFVNLHTTAGLGNAVNALATARQNRAPLVVVVGQQDRRHLATEPFLAGRLEGLAGDYPVSVELPIRAAEVPGAIARAWHAAGTGRGPAVVVVPMDDWDAAADATGELAAPARLVRTAGADPEALDELAAMVREACSPAMVVGAGAWSPASWAATTRLAEHLDCPVWQEAFGAQAGFPQDHRLFAGHLSAGRARLRETLAPHDVVLVVGAPVFRQYGFEPGTLVPEGTRVAVITDDAAEAHRSPAELAVLGAPAPVCDGLVARVPRREARRTASYERPAALAPPGPGEPLLAGHVLQALADRLPRDVVLLEESPSSKPELHARIPAREPLGFVSTAMGGLGFALPGAVGLRMALPDRPVVAVVGDGSSLYAIQALWSAAHYGVGALFVVLANGRYAVMHQLAEGQGKSAPWPAFDEVDVGGLATALGCPARRVEDLDGLHAALDEIVPGLAARTAPLVLEVPVAPGRYEPV
jgi:thiamine pyrophosphate-dependent acetolactate synthase large subunit-like protein